MRRILLLLALIAGSETIGQEINFKKVDLSIKEPYKKGIHKKDTFEIELKADKLPANPITVEIQRNSGSTYPDSLFSIITKTINPLKEKNTVKVSVSSHLDGDEDQFVLLVVNWKTSTGESMQIKDTLYIRNSYPFKGIAEKDYTDWNDCKRAEVFVGTNFDFIDSKVTLSDWYGGARVFLPSITDFRYRKGKRERIPRFGFAGGLYHAKSLSNFGNPLNNTEYTSVYGRITSYEADSAHVRYDTVKTKTKTEINNWGFYVTPIYQWSKFESPDGKFVTNLYIGFHAEVIRRNITYDYTFDTLSSTTRKYKTTQLPGHIFELPPDNTQTFYDSYFGVSIPIQFLWKDILEIKLSPCVGLGSRDYTSQITKGDEGIKRSPAFYLFHFDLLAKLGGLRLNIGGEVRGYFPNERPIITAYLGTSFTIQKLVDFVTK
jgi:hypothetical protein